MSRSGSAASVLLWMTVAQAGATLDQQGLGSLAPFLASELRLDHAALGALFGAIYLGSTIFTAPSGILVDRFGERAIVVGSGLLMGAAVALAALVPHAGWVTGWLFVFGALYAASSPAGGRAILRWFPANRGMAMGVRQAGAPLGGALGALLLPAVALHAGGYRPALVAGGAVCALSAVAAGLGYREPADETAAHASPPLAQLVRGMWRFVVERRALAVNVGAFLLASGQYSVVAFLVLALFHDGFARPLATFSLAIVMTAGTVARPLWGILSDRIFAHERAYTLAIVGVVGALGSLWLGALPAAGGAAGAVAIAVVLGATTVGFTGLLNTVFAEIGGAQAAGSAIGVGLTFNYAAGFVTPPLFGAIVDRWGFPVAWRFLALNLTAAALVILAGTRSGGRR